jgi:hypothetical protein
LEGGFKASGDWVNLGECSGLVDAMGFFSHIFPFFGGNVIVGCWFVDFTHISYHPVI